MIQVGTKLNIADNSGAKIVKCFRILGGTRHRYARLGDIVIASVKIAEPRKQVKKKDIVRVVIARSRNAYRRKDGSYIRFDDNAAIILDGKEPRGGRIFGPMPRELRERGFAKIISLAEEVV